MAKRKKITADLDELMPILIGIWRRMFRLSGPETELQTREFRAFVGHVLALYKLDLDEESFIEAMKNRDLLGAYLLYFYPLKLQEAISLMSELPSHGQKALDISIVPSAYALSALKFGYTDVTSLGVSEEVLKATAEVVGRLGYPLNVRTTNIASLNPLKEKYDLITISYALFDLFPSDTKEDCQKRKDLLINLIQSLTETGFLLIVESSLEKKNKRFLEMRNLLNACGFTIQAPCIYQGQCPALAYKNMCFAQRDVEKPYLINEANRSGKINMNSLKMSYLIIKSKRGAPLEVDKNLYRIISPPFDDSGKKAFYLCGKGGRKKIASELKEHSADTKPFEYLKRGEAIEIDLAKIQGNTFVLDHDSKLKVIAPLSKPLDIYAE